MLIEEKKEFLLQATVIEARHLKGKDSSGMSNPFAKITCGDLSPQTSEVIYESLTPTWNQTFTFQGLMMNDTDMQTSEVTFEVWSKNNFFGNNLIGKFSVGLSTLYKNANHEYFNVWLVLSNPDEDPDDTQGYLLINCFIIGPGDRPPVHDANEKVNQDLADDDEEVDIDQMNFDQLRAYQEKKQGIIVLGKPAVARKSFQLSVYIFKCENLVSFGAVLGTRKPSVFISSRAVGLVQKTKCVRDNNSPTINQKMLFPCYFPFLNDKILLRMWNWNAGAADEFVANIPEFPKQNDFFNISKLISIGGRMAAKWVNLYGIPPSERNNQGIISTKKKHPREGTWFMGRVMLSFSLLANEKPLCATIPCNPFYEPDTQAYRLFCDIYEVKYLKEETYDITVWCDCRIGSNTTGESRHRKPKKNRVVWEKKDKANEISLPQILMENYPKDVAQIPDIFINLYTGGEEKGGERIGYIRLDTEEVLKWEPIPRWLHFKPLDMNKDSPGSVLCNLQFLVESENTKRIFKQKGILKKFVLHYYIVQGFELDPKNSDEDIHTFVEVTLDIKSKSTQAKCGRFPFWNDYEKIPDIELDLKLDFAPDVVVTVYKQVKKGMFSDKTENEEIGRFTVPIRCIKKEGKTYPHYFNLIKSNEVNGRIMAMFYIEPQKKNLNDNKDIFPIRYNLREEKKADIKIFVLGMRNLDFEPKMDGIEFKVELCTNNKEDNKNQTVSQELIKKVNNENDENENILNVINIFEFKDVKIYGGDNFQVFPYAKITFKQSRLFFDDERFLLFNLSDYCESVSDHTKKLYRQLFEQNLGKVTLDQEQKFLDEFEKLNEKNNNDEEEYIGLNEDEEIAFKSDNKEKESVPLIKEKVKEERYDENADRKLVKLMSKYKNMVVSDDIVLICKNKDKIREKEIKKNLRKKLVRELKELQKNELTTPEQISRLLDLQEQVRRLKKPQMTEPMFYSFDDVADEFDYGREIWKEDIYEFHKDLDIPYKKKNLYFIPKSLFTEKFQTMNGYMKLGKESSCIIKFNVDIQMKESKEETTTTGGRMQKYLDNKKITREINDDGIDKELQEEVNRELINYNIFNETFLKKLRNLYLNKNERKNLSNSKKEIVVPLNSVRVRVYIYRCQNLTAQDNNATIIDRLAGYAAYCKADAFLDIRVGTNISADSSKGVKRIIDRSAYVPNSLSPEFYKYFELEADLPQDWKLTVNVMSKVEGSLTDTLIGSTEIDLEDRYLGELRTRSLLKYKSLEAYYDDYLKELEMKTNENNGDLIDKINKKIMYLNRLSDDLKPVKIPVEYRPLLKPGTKTAQGVIEMFVEIFPQSLARLMKPAKIEPPPPQEYELRLVIWETRNIPLGNKKAIDVNIRVMYDPEGWLSKEIRKETDTHLGCKDGRAVFNWRMKFPIKIPCTFPRLYFAVYDFNAFSSDDAIGTSYISLKRIFKRLLQEGKLTIDKMWIPLTSIEDPGEIKGEILYSIYLLQKYEADQNPVGDSWDEPNKDPKLEKPKEGRGIGDFLAGTFLDFSDWKFNFSLFGSLKIIAIISIVLIIFVILFVAPGVLVK